MKRLSEPLIDDNALINLLANRNALASHPLLLNSLPLILSQYEAYSCARGDVSNINPPAALQPGLGDALRGHYKNEINGLEFIAEIRNSISPDVCPMCGGFGTSQVDHVAPKEQYPEYSFFSRNLVPACECNTKKGIKYKGEKAGERVLHPYYDDAMRERLMFLKFSGDPEYPDISVCAMLSHASNPALQFHIENIIRKTQLKTWAAKQWGNLKRSPSGVIPGLRYVVGEITESALVEFINDELDASDDIFETPNNWKSMLMFGIVQQPIAIAYLTLKINDLRRNKAEIV